MGRLDAIEARLKAATPGPWWVETDYCDCGGDYQCSHGEFAYQLRAAGRKVPAWPSGVTDACIANFTESNDTTMADAALIAHAPADLAALLRVVKALREERQIVKNYKAWLNDENPFYDGPRISDMVERRTNETDAALAALEANDDPAATPDTE